MPRTLIALTLAALLLAGCTMAPFQKSASDDTAQVAPPPSIEPWLDLHSQASELSTAEALEQLVALQQPQNEDQLFYYGLLNQQLQTYGAWTQARDTFQQLQETDALPPEQQQLAGILRQYNQNRINWYVRQGDLLKKHAELEQQLQQASEQNLLLQQKIQALTELETVISTRKEE